MSIYELSKACKESLGRIIRGCSPRVGMASRFPQVLNFLEWLSSPPNAPKNKLARVQLGEIHFPLYVKESDSDISPYIYAQHCWEKVESELFIRSLKQGIWVLDVGAHFGYYSILAGKVLGAEGKVFSFEPDPENRLLLNRNVILNSLKETVRVFSQAASNKNQIQNLYGSSSLRTGDRHLFKTQGDRITVKVESVRIGDFLEDIKPESLSRIQVVKMDVEGYEPFAFDGLMKVLQPSRPLTLFTEVNYARLRQAGSSAGHYLDQIKQMGFEIFKINPKATDASHGIEKICVEDYYADRPNHIDLICTK